MIVCPRCGFNSLDGTKRCIRCNADLAAPTRPVPSVRRRLPTLRLAAPLRGAAEQLRARLFPPPSLDLPVRQPFVAATLSLVPGCGQFYNHQPPLGLVHLGVYLALVGGGIALVLDPMSSWLFLAATVWTVYSVNQAFQTAQIVNGATFPRLQGWRNFLAFLFLGAVFFAALQWLALGWIVLAVLLVLMALAFAADQGARRGGYGQSSPRAWLIPVLFLAVNLLAFFWLPGFFYRPAATLRWIGQSAYAPLVHEGDRVAFEAIAFGFQGPQLGDIVLYDPPRFQVEAGLDIYLVNMTLGMERIVGLPGDLIERRAGEWFRNGEPAPPWEQPLVQDQLWDELRLEVPPGQYAVLISYSPSEFTVMGEVTAPTLKYSIVNGWAAASTVPAEKMFGRAVCVYSPAPHRRWLTRGAMRKASETKP